MLAFEPDELEQRDWSGRRAVPAAGSRRRSAGSAARSRLIRRIASPSPARANPHGLSAKVSSTLAVAGAGRIAFFTPPFQAIDFGVCYNCRARPKRQAFHEIAQ
jgi:hypothetical protein